VILFLFVLTYVVIALGRFPGTTLDRTSGAVVGAALMVAVGGLSPEAVYVHALNHDTLVLLFGMMCMTSFLAESGFFARASDVVLRRAKTPRGLLVALCVGSGLLSAFLVNDTVCVMFTPLCLQVILDARLPPLPYLLAVGLGANVGSAATLTGNPQNMLIGQLSHLSYGRFLLACGPAAAAGTLAAAAVLVWLFADDLPTEPFRVERAPPAVDARLLGLCGAVLGGVVLAFFLGRSMAWSALAGASVLFVFGQKDPRQVLARVDFGLLAFFSGLFVVVYALDQGGYARAALDAARPLFGGTAGAQFVRFSALSALASNVVSNVPFVLLVGDTFRSFAEPQVMWAALAVSCTLAGNLTIVGSVANIIVLELARDRVQVSFWGFLRYGVPVTLASSAVALAVLWATTRLGALG
jgi:Na+/H+ antiporter NhaD/arsenite permease-like protein